VAFDIADLIKLAESPANDRSAGTLVDFLIRTLETNYPDFVGWTKELSDVKQTKEASWEKVDLGMKEIQSQLNTVKTLTKEITPVGSHDQFSKIIAAISRAEKELEPTKSLFEGVERDWQNVAKLFAKEADKIKPEAFCGIIWEFVTKYNNTIEDRIKREEAAQKQRAKDKAREDIEKKKEALNKRKTELEQRKSTKETSLSDSDKEEPSTPPPSKPTNLSSSTQGSPLKTPQTTPERTPPTNLAASTPAASKDEDVQVDEVFQEFEKNPNAGKSSNPKSVGSAAEKRKLLEEKRKKLAAARAAKNKT